MKPQRQKLPIFLFNYSFAYSTQRTTSVLPEGQNKRTLFFVDLIEASMIWQQFRSRVLANAKLCFLPQTMPPSAHNQPTNHSCFDSHRRLEMTD